MRRDRAEGQVSMACNCHSRSHSSLMPLTSLTHHPHLSHLSHLSHLCSWVIRHGPDDYKTGKQYGERPPMVLPPFLYPELNAFIEVWRAELQPQHLGLFCRLCDGASWGRLLTSRV